MVNIMKAKISFYYTQKTEGILFLVLLYKPIISSLCCYIIIHSSFFLSTKISKVHSQT